MDGAGELWLRFLFRIREKVELVVTEWWEEGWDRWGGWVEGYKWLVEAWVEVVVAGAGAVELKLQVELQRAFVVVEHGVVELILEAKGK